MDARIEAVVKEIRHVQVRLASNASQLAGSDDVLKTFLLACESKNNKLSIMGLAGVDKLIAHDAVAPSVLPSILATLKEVRLHLVYLLTLLLILSLPHLNAEEMRSSQLGLL